MPSLPSNFDSRMLVGFTLTSICISVNQIDFGFYKFSGVATSSINLALLTFAKLEYLDQIYMLRACQPESAQPILQLVGKKISHAEHTAKSLVLSIENRRLVFAAIPESLVPEDFILSGKEIDILPVGN